MAILRQAIKQFGTPAAILSDSGSCFVGMREGNPKGSWKPTAFEEELLGGGIGISSRPRRPKTNWNLEWSHRTMEEIGSYESLPEYAGDYNGRGLHLALDAAIYETPLMAFSAKKTAEEISKRPQRGGWNRNDGRT